MPIHTRIQQGRKRLGMTPEQFGNALGVSRGAVQQWERADGTAPNRKKQPAVAKLLGLTVAELMAQDDRPPQEHQTPATPLHARENNAPIYHLDLGAVIKQLATHLAAMDQETRHLAGSLLRELALNPRNHQKVGDALGAIIKSENRISASTSPPKFIISQREHEPVNCSQTTLKDMINDTKYKPKGIL